jgi:histone-lysine N-methyltransferase SETD3
MDILPGTYETALYINSETELRKLKSSPWLEEIVKLCRSIGRQYAYFCTQMNTPKTPASRLPFKNHFKYELYRWAVSTVMTRQNFIPTSDGREMINALIPLWDLSNHVQGKHSTDFDLDQNAALCYAMNSFAPSQEITIFYGTRSNGEFFIHNGFVYGDNANDFFPLKLGISKNDPLFAVKSALAAKLGLPASGCYRLFNNKDQKDAKLLAFLRIFHLTQDQIDKWAEVDDLTPFSEQTCDKFAETDEKVEIFLKTRASLLLRAYPENDVIDGLIDKLLDSEKKILKSYTS